MLFSAGVAQAQRKAGRTSYLAVVVAAVMVIWLGVASVVASSGVLSNWSAIPPLIPALPLIAVASLVALSLTRSFSRMLDHVPLWQPVVLQSFRVAVELAFWRLHVDGLAPIQITFEGRNFDALVGLTAPIIAVGVAHRWIGPRLLVTWNLFGLAMLFNAIATVTSSVPGQLHANWPGEPFTEIATWPVVWIPALLAPMGIFLHLVSIRQALSKQTVAGPA